MHLNSLEIGMLTMGFLFPQQLQFPVGKRIKTTQFGGWKKMKQNAAMYVIKLIKEMHKNFKCSTK